VTWVHIQFGNEYDLNYSMYAKINKFSFHKIYPKHNMFHKMRIT